MNYGLIYDCDPGNGPGLRISLFVSGCTHHCPGCFNEETWDFAYGEQYISETQAGIIRMLSRPHIQGLTILGGEPMEPANQPQILALVKEVREKCSGKDIWIYSGYTFEQLNEKQSNCHTSITEDILALTDVLVDGRFEISQKDVTLSFRGSRNQRILDVQRSRQTNSACWLEQYM